MTSGIHAFIFYLSPAQEFQLQQGGVSSIFFTIVCLLPITASDKQKLKERKARAHLGVTGVLAWILMVFLSVGVTGTDPGSSFESSANKDSGWAD